MDITFFSINSHIIVITPLSHIFHITIEFQIYIKYQI